MSSKIFCKFSKFSSLADKNISSIVESPMIPKQFWISSVVIFYFLLIIDLGILRHLAFHHLLNLRCILQRTFQYQYFLLLQLIGFYHKLCFWYFLKVNLWHLDNTVIGTFWISVVAKMKITCFGGSSKVFRKAFHALCDSMWTSSIIYILYLEFEGRIFTLSRSSLISSTPLFDAASISIISGFSLKFYMSCIHHMQFRL